MKMRESLLVNCSAEHLWSFIHEPEKQKLWMKGLLSNESTSPGHEGVGSTFRMAIKEGMKVAFYDGEVTVLERPSRLEVIFGGGGFPKGAYMRVNYQLTEQVGQTRLDYSAVFEGKKPGFFLRLLLPLFLLFGRMQLRSFLKTLKGLAEASPLAA